MEAFWLDLVTIRKTYPNLKLSGSVYVENEGNKNFSNIENSTCLGTTGKSLRLEAFLLNATGLPVGKKQIRSYPNLYCLKNAGSL